MNKKQKLQASIKDAQRKIDLKVKIATRALDNDELEKAEQLEQEIAELRKKNSRKRRRII